MKKIIAAVITGLLFAGEIFLLKTYDVAMVEETGTEVGFSHINFKVHDMTGVNMLWYDITNYIGLAAIAVCAVFALAGLVQLIKRKSLFKVDREILSLGGLFVAVIACYLVFEKVIINYRPVIMPGETAPEASFPSSHTMLAVTVFIAVTLVIDQYIKSDILAGVVKATCVVIAAVAVGGRLFSGVHWLTDIVGGILLSLALLFVFAALLGDGSDEYLLNKNAPVVSDRDKVINGYRCKH